MKPCLCPRYPWPHRKGGGSCIWNPVNDEAKCLDCGNASKVIYARDNDYAPMSACCGAEVVQNGTLRTAPESCD